MGISLKGQSVKKPFNLDLNFLLSMKDAIRRGIVKTVTNGVHISRRGRGYSKNELIQSGVTDILTARKNKVPIDPFRTTAHEENIEKLKAFFSQEGSKMNTKAKKT